MSAPWLVAEVSARCELACAFCYNPWRDGRALPDELPTVAWREVFERAIAVRRPRGVTLAGGEPLLRDDLEVLASYLSRRGLGVAVATSGVGLDRRRAEALVRAGVQWFEIGLPTVDRDVLRELVGRDTVTDAIDGVQAAQAAGASAALSVVLVRPVLPSLGATLDLARGLSVARVTLNRFVPGGRGARNAAALDPGDEGLAAALDVAEDRARCGLEVHLGLPIEPCRFPVDRWPHVRAAICACGVGKSCIDPRGRFATCEQAADAPFAGGRAAQCAACADRHRCGGGCRALGPLPEHHSSARVAAGSP